LAGNFRLSVASRSKKKRANLPWEAVSAASGRAEYGTVLTQWVQQAKNFSLLPSFREIHIRSLLDAFRA
jgi:hypothetical protein